jgi:hypothetical protein
MATIIRLNDLQLVLLAAAAERDNASLIPLPTNGLQVMTRINQAISGLLRRALIEERPVTDRALVWRQDGDNTIGLFITQAGRGAIGVSDTPDGKRDKAGKASKAEKAAKEEATPPAPSSSKIAQVLSLLRRDEGATLAEMVEATGWLPHTTRAALTGLRKKGHTITKGNRENTTCYHIEAQA